jgi:hypothetical protein
MATKRIQQKKSYKKAVVSKASAKKTSPKKVTKKKATVRTSKRPVATKKSTTKKARLTGKELKKVVKAKANATKKAAPKKAVKKVPAKKVVKKKKEKLTPKQKEQKNLKTMVRGFEWTQQGSRSACSSHGITPGTDIPSSSSHRTHLLQSMSCLTTSCFTSRNSTIRISLAKASAHTQYAMASKVRKDRYWFAKAPDTVVRRGSCGSPVWFAAAACSRATPQVGRTKA